ncbi:hypothetical protein HpCK38_15120 [Helicobacter pylori]
MKKILAILVLCSSLFGELQITPEFGGNIGVNNNQNLTYGAYTRVWFGIDKFVFAPQVRAEFTQDYTNIKGGFILGGEATDFLTPYIGASYSYFSQKYKNSFDIEAGLMFFLPFFSIGIYGDWGMSKLKIINKTEHIFGGGLSIGIPF